MCMLNGTWPQIRQIKTRQSPKFCNWPKFLPSKITHYMVWTTQELGLLHIIIPIHLKGISGCNVNQPLFLSKIKLIEINLDLHDSLMV